MTGTILITVANSSLAIPVMFYSTPFPRPLLPSPSEDLISDKVPKLRALVSIQVAYTTHLALTLRILPSFDALGAEAVFLGSESNRSRTSMLQADLQDLVKPRPDSKGKEMGQGLKR
ncbi:hypothetical protein CC78DRAFT_575700 [Lojkania enalia]|uniref:Uncharacterized protein n=1 Tax=Lojkania enalia TaxID=147567 RepID=A0A9P4KGI5_9PLEO|nr:hypothetical protein CC78DRAFT_575700 [Didymosphaeria enalia]